MADPKKESSAALPLRMGAFGALFTTLCVAFDAPLAFIFTLVATVLLAKV